MPDQSAVPRNSVSLENLPRGRAARAGRWTVVNRNDEYRAVSSRCRHQLADLSKGSLDSHGCLVCPWHASRYDLDTGEMVAGPQGFAGYTGPTPGYSGLVRWTVGRILPLRRRSTRVEGDRVFVQR
jgi:nitrite reductase/ring-hydroxylating ferredoxin subunit